MKYFVLLALLAIIALGVSLSPKVFAAVEAGAELQIGETDFSVDVAASSVAQVRGLSWRETMAADSGMVFVYTQPRHQSFWMYGMQFPLDFVWIRDFTVIGIHENVGHPEANNGEIIRVSSPEPADMVLEINAGEIAKNGIKVGDPVTFYRFAASR